MEQKEPVLTILAAGMGSRYGGLKQIDPIGPNGEIILDYSLYDAKQAGFQKVVFIIKEELQDIFEEKIGARARRLMDVSYVYQKLNDLPAGVSVPEGRVKPWGTGHAVYGLRQAVSAPFGVINADDFYGRDTFCKLYAFLSSVQDDAISHYCMVGFELQNTLTDNGTVSRGVCQVSDHQMLQHVVERTNISSDENGVYCIEEGKRLSLPADAVASLNVWGFTPSLFPELERGLRQFFAISSGDPLKREFYLPAAVDELIQLKKADVYVQRSVEKWYGVTYREDKETVRAALTKMHSAGLYPKLTD